MNAQSQLASAVLFLNPEGISKEQISKITKIKNAELLDIIENLSTKYKELGLELVHQDNQYILLVSKEISKHNKQLVKDSEQISSSALEVLSIIAYKQPVSLDEIQNTRGVNSEQSVKSLMERGLIEESRVTKSGIVHITYHTTILFLKQLGIKSLNELPEK